MYALGRLLQAFALFLLPLAIVMELTGSFEERSLTQMLKFMLFGIVIFYTGHVLQTHSKK